MMITKTDLLSFTYFEDFHLDNGVKLIKNFDKVIEQLPPQRQKKILDKMKEFDPLNAIKKMVKNKNGINQVKYAFSKSSKNYGRLFAKSVSLQNLPREFRGLLSYGLYYDIDIENAHPNFLYQYCNQKGIKCDNLEYYVKNRNTIIKEFTNKYDLSRDDVKDIFLTLLNGGDREGLTSTDEFLKKFKAEMTTIHNLIVQLNPKILKDVKKSNDVNDHNINGKVINRILCDIENDVMLTCVEYLMKKGFKVCVLIFDGFMVRIEEGKTVNQELLNEVSIYAFEKTKYDVKLVEKPLDNSINLDLFDDELNDEDLSSQVTYYRQKEEFEKTHFKICFPPTYATIDNDEIYIQSTNHFRETHSHIPTTILKKLNGKPYLDEVHFTKVWFDDKHIRVYKKVDFFPKRDLCPSDNYNLFKGFKAENYEPINDVEKINKLIEPIIYQLKIIAQEHYEFILTYFAFILQYPHKKTQVNIITSGKDGTGKSMMFDYFREHILGDDVSIQTEDTDNIFGKFSNFHVKRLFLQIDEICTEDFSKKNVEKLKNITTSKTIKYEKKGFDPININNYVNIVMTTNNDFTIPISQTDRRNVFFKSLDTHLGDKDYWKQLHQHLEKQEVARAFYEYLMNYDLSALAPNWSEGAGLQFCRPNTEYNKEIKLMCLPYIYRFLSALTCYTDEYSEVDNTYNENDYIYIRAMRFYKLYEEWFKNCNFSCKIITPTKFFMDIKNINEDKAIEKKKGRDNNYYLINKTLLKDYLVSKSLYDENSFIN